MKTSEYYCDICGERCEMSTLTERVTTKERYYKITETTPHIDYGWFKPHDRQIDLCAKCYNKIDGLIDSLYGE